MASPRIEPFRLATLALAASALLLVLASPAAARTTRAYTSSFGSFTPGTGGAHSSPGALAVDQSNGDIYAVDTNGSTLKRYTSAGAPDNFTCGTCSGNSLSVSGSVAVDNSGDGLGGDFYVTSGSTVKVFDSTGASLGTITGTAIAGVGISGGHFDSVCGVTVDQSNGDLYVSGIAPNNTFNDGAHRIWRYAPASPAAPLDDSDYTFAGGIQGPAGNGDRPCSIAADHGNLYAIDNNNGDNQVRRYSASDFDPSIPTVTGAVVDSGPATALAVDPGDGDLYVNEGARVNVYDSSGAFLYYFGAAAYFGAGQHPSSGVAVKSATTPGNPAVAAYASDPSTDHQVAAFGPLALAPTYTHLSLASFGTDGSSAGSFSNGAPGRLAFANAAGHLFALDATVPGIYGFDASTLPPGSPFSPFNPLATAAFPDTGSTANPAGLAVDNTASPSTTTARLYLASPITNLLYGFSSAGTALAGFNPLDPATSPGGAEASKSLCGAAVDSSGNVYLANSATKHILKYDSTGAYLSTIDVSAQGAPCNLAFDSHDNLYATIAGNGDSGSGGGVFRYTAASAYSSASAVRLSGYRPGSLGALSLAVDPSDDHLFVANHSDASGSWVDEFDSAGNLIDEFSNGLAAANGVAVDPANGDVYVAGASQVKAFSPGLLYPQADTAAASNLTNASVTLHGTVITQGVTLTDCKFQYVSTTAFRADQAAGHDGFTAATTKSCDQSPGSIPLDLSEHQVTATAGDLTENTDYRFRILASNAEGTTTTPDAGFSSAGPPLVQTTGSPVRTATTVVLLGRVDPSRVLTHYHFEYLSDADYSANGGGFSGPNAPTRVPASPGDDVSAGSGNLFEFASQRVSGLDPDTTYHYRIVADNGNPDGPASGDGFTLTTQASDDPLDHGSYPGPPGSDRAWEMVSLPDSSGNPINIVQAFSDDGDKAVYSVSGGTPLADSGSFFSMYFSQRPDGDHPTEGWQSSFITPPRAQLLGSSWFGLYGAGDLSNLVSHNYDASGLAAGDQLWRLRPGGSPQRLFQATPPQHTASFGNLGSIAFGASADGSRAVESLQGGSLDPNYPSAASVPNFYDVSSGGAPQLLSILPSGNPPACGVDHTFGFSADGITVRQASGWVSDDSVLFPSQGDNCSSHTQIYLRDIAAAQTKLVSLLPGGTTEAGPACQAGLIRVAGGGIFFWTQSDLSPQDTAPSSCGGVAAPDGDVYRYDIATGDIECLTCLVPGLPADVEGADAQNIGVSDDGSRLYFDAAASLLPGDGPGVYRLRVASGDLAYVGLIAHGEDIGTDTTGTGYSPDGRFFSFQADDVALNPLGGTADNGGTRQTYLYDDADGSLTCVSCPGDGSAPTGPVDFAQKLPQPNQTTTSANGIVAFATKTPLVAADTDGTTDVYEFRDGRVMLVTDGVTSTLIPPFSPGIDPSGRDLLFAADAALTPDAPDSYKRLYDARIGGGIDFPPVGLPPCDLNSGACEGPGTSAPDQPGAGSGVFQGQANHGRDLSPKPKRCRKGQVKRHGRCVAKKPHKRKHKAKRHHKRSHRRAARHNRRARR